MCLRVSVEGVVRSRVQSLQVLLGFQDVSVCVCGWCGTKSDVGFQDVSVCVCGWCGTKSDAVTAGSPGVPVCVCGGWGETSSSTACSY